MLDLQPHKNIFNSGVTNEAGGTTPGDNIGLLNNDVEESCESITLIPPVKKDKIMQAIENLA